MAEPMLTSLCAICHVSTPKYKCPRCNLRTCSLACIKKHKAWSECSGERDATVYVPPSKLRTAAGIDHDYNFIHGIELEVERRERVLVGDRSLVKEEELRPLTVQEVKWKQGRDGKRRKVVTTRVLREAKGRVFEKHLAGRLKQLGVRIMCAPMGMKRQKENCTTLNRRTGRVNWQVEWLAVDGEEGGGRHDGLEEERLLSKVMDDVPLYQAYYELLQDRRPVAGKPKVRPVMMKPHQMQNPDGKWITDVDGIQDPQSSCWLCPAEVDSEEDQRRRQQYQFFLGCARTRSDLPTKLTALKNDECLREILREATVLEFPTIYVMRNGTTLPEGFVLSQPQASTQKGTKRKHAPGNKGPGSKKRKQSGESAADLEDGEVDSDDEAQGSIGGGDILEPGDVIGEESFDEEEGMDEDDETSSSGSDTE